MSDKKPTPEEEFDAAPAVDPEREFEAATAPPEPTRMEKIAGFLKKAPGAVMRAAEDVNATPIRVLAGGLERELGPDQPTGAALRGFGHGASYGVVDKLRGVHGAVDEAAKRLSPIPFRPEDQEFPKESFFGAIGKRYAQERDASYHEQDVADAKQPVISGLSKVAGAVATPNPFSKLGAGIKAAEGAGLAARGAAAAGRFSGRLAAGAGQGEIYGLGSSRAPDLKGKFVDTAQAGGIGMGVAAAAAPVSALAKYMGGIRASGAEAQEALQSKLAQKDVMSERGRFGSLSKEPLAAYRTLDSEIAAGAATPEQAAEYAAFKSSPLGVSTRQRAIANLLKMLPGHEGQMVEAEGAFGAASANAEPAAVKAATDAKLGESVIKNDILPRIDRLVGNKALSMIGEFGGAPITTTKNLLKTPTFQHRVGQVGEAAAAGISSGITTAGKAAQPVLNSSPLADYLRPMDEEERKKKSTEAFEAGTR